MFNLFVVCVPSPTFPLELSDVNSSLVFFLYTSKTFLSMCFRVVPHPHCCLLFVEEGLVVHFMLFSMLITASPESVSLLLCLPGLRRLLPHCLHCDCWLLLIEMSCLRQKTASLSYTCLLYSVRSVSASLLTFGYTHHQPIRWTSGNCPANQNYGHQTWRRSHGRGRRRMWEAEQGGRSRGSRGAVGGDPSAPFPGATQAGFI